jgi:hypothetical protein
MRTFKISLAIVIAALFVMGLGSTVYAFHSGGVGGCEGCHTMHNSLGGTSIIPGGTVGSSGAFLLKGETQSDACFECHYKTTGTGGTTSTMTSYVVGSGPSGFGPAGDFAWLTTNWGTASQGYQHGHNIYSVEHGINPDPRFVALGTSPGGNYPYGDGTNFGCQSCHDPHGKYRYLTTGAEDNGNTANSQPIYTGGSSGSTPTVYGGVNYATGVYRILGGNGYSPKSVGGFAFNSLGVMKAVAGTGSLTAAESTTQFRIAYGYLASDWCANCHAAMHSSTSPGTVHPVDGAAISGTSGIIANYNKYVRTGDLSATAANSFNSLVPFQSDNLGATLDNTWQAQLKTVAGGATGMDATSRVTCQSCHRSHASGFNSMTRFLAAGETAFVTNWNSATASVQYATGSGLPPSQLEYTAAMNGRPATIYKAYQRLLCNKCHIKD